MKKVLIAVTAGMGLVHARCAEALLENIETLQTEGYEVKTYFHSGDCYISRARDVCANVFIMSGFDDMIFVDSDLWFERTAMLKLLKHDVDIVGGAYTRKDGSGEYPVMIRTQPNMVPLVDEKTGLIEATSVPTGLMRINERVFNRLISLRFYDEDNDGIKYFFEQGFQNLYRLWRGEDVRFCEKSLLAGIKIWIEPRITFKHIGWREHEGNYHEFLMRQPKPTHDIKMDSFASESSPVDTRNENAFYEMAR